VAAFLWPAPKWASGNALRRWDKCLDLGRRHTLRVNWRHERSRVVEVPRIRVVRAPQCAKGARNRLAGHCAHKRAVCRLNMCDEDQSRCKDRGIGNAARRPVAPLPLGRVRPHLERRVAALGPQRENVFCFRRSVGGGWGARTIRLHLKRPPKI